MEVMQVIWNLNRSVTSSKLLEIISEKAWQGQTINTFYLN